MTPSRLAVSVSLLLAALATGSPAAADEPVPTDPAARTAFVQKLTDEGLTAYQARDYRKANERFQHAYAVDPDPNLLYNMAKCFEALGDKQTAIEKYEIFINSPGADSSGRVKAQEAVKVLRGSPPVAPGGSPPAAAPATGATPSSSGRSAVPAVVAFSVGGIGIAVGSIFGISALGKRSDLDSACSSRLCPPKSKDDITSLKTTSTISTIGFIVGGVGVAAGGLLLVLNRPSAERSAGAHVSPYVGVGTAGVTGTF